MDCIKWYKSKVKKLHWYDVSLIKLSTFAFALMIAKLWLPILSLEWYWYLALALLAAVKPMMNVFGK